MKWEAQVEWDGTPPHYVVQTLTLDDQVVYVDPELKRVADGMVAQMERRKSAQQAKIRRDRDKRRNDEGWSTVGTFEGRGPKWTELLQITEPNWQIRWSTRGRRLVVTVFGEDGRPAGQPIRFDEKKSIGSGIADPKLPPGWYRFEVETTDYSWKLVIEQ